MTDPTFYDYFNAVDEFDTRAEYAGTTDFYLEGSLNDGNGSTRTSKFYMTYDFTDACLTTTINP